MGGDAITQTTGNESTCWRHRRKTGQPPAGTRTRPSHAELCRTAPATPRHASPRLSTPARHARLSPAPLSHARSEFFGAGFPKRSNCATRTSATADCARLPLPLPLPARTLHVPLPLRRCGDGPPRRGERRWQQMAPPPARPVTPPCPRVAPARTNTAASGDLRRYCQQHGARQLGLCAACRCPTSPGPGLSADGLRPWVAGGRAGGLVAGSLQTSAFLPAALPSPCVYVWPAPLTGTPLPSRLPSAAHARSPDPLKFSPNLHAAAPACTSYIRRVSGRTPPS